MADALRGADHLPRRRGSEPRLPPDRTRCGGGARDPARTSGCGPGRPPAGVAERATGGKPVPRGPRGAGRGPGSAGEHGEPLSTPSGGGEREGPPVSRPASPPSGGEVHAAAPRNLRFPAVRLRKRAVFHNSPAELARPRGLPDRDSAALRRLRVGQPKEVKWHGSYSEFPWFGWTASKTTPARTHRAREKGLLVSIRG